MNGTSILSLKTQSEALWKLNNYCHESYGMLSVTQEQAEEEF